MQLLRHQFYKPGEVIVLIGQFMTLSLNLDSCFTEPEIRFMGRARASVSSKPGIRDPYKCIMYKKSAVLRIQGCMCRLKEVYYSLSIVEVCVTS